MLFSKWIGIGSCLFQRDSWLLDNRWHILLVIIPHHNPSCCSIFIIIVTFALIITYTLLSKHLNTIASVVKPNRRSVLLGFVNSDLERLWCDFKSFIIICVCLLCLVQIDKDVVVWLIRCLSKSKLQLLSFSIGHKNLFGLLLSIFEEALMRSTSLETVAILRNLGNLRNIPDHNLFSLLRRCNDDLLCHSKG